MHDPLFLGLDLVTNRRDFHRDPDSLTQRGCRGLRMPAPHGHSLNFGCLLVESLQVLYSRKNAGRPRFSDRPGQRHVVLAMPVAHSLASLEPRIHHASQSAADRIESGNPRLHGELCLLLCEQLLLLVVGLCQCGLLNQILLVLAQISGVERFLLLNSI